jgi:hypothetical protein
MRGGLRPRFRAGRARKGQALRNHALPPISKRLIIYAFASDGAETQAAQRWAVVRRSTRRAISLYAGQIRAKLRLSTGCSQIAVPGGGPLRRGALRP